MNWYYSAGGDRVGPHSADDIENLFHSGQLSAETLVWRKGLADWVPLADAEEFAPLFDDALPPPVPPAQRQATADTPAGELLADARAADDAVADDRPGDDHPDDDQP